MKACYGYEVVVNCFFSPRQSSVVPAYFGCSRAGMHWCLRRPQRSRATSRLSPQVPHSILHSVGRDVAPAEAAGSHKLLRLPNTVTLPFEAYRPLVRHGLLEQAQLGATCKLGGKRAFLILCHQCHRWSTMHAAWASSVLVDVRSVRCGAIEAFALAAQSRGAQFTNVSGQSCVAPARVEHLLFCSAGDPLACNDVLLLWG